MKKGLLAFAVTLFLWQVYRAAVTAVTPREAVLFTQFASKPFSTIVASPFDPANQILHALLVARFIRIFRLTEFTLRLASLLGFVLYLLASFRFAAGRKWGWLALICCLLNPFTIGWLPESTGVWMAAGLFLLALRNLTQAKVGKPELTKAVLQLGLAIGFDVYFAVPILVLSLFILWGKKRSLSHSLHEFVTPILLISLGLWGLTVLRTVPETWPNIQKIVANGIRSSHRFHSGPEGGLPRASRALRDDIRRHDFRAVRVVVSDELGPSFDFYRSRYALGATKKVSDPATADYWVGLDADPRFQAGSGVTRIFQRDGISVYRRD